MTALRNDPTSNDRAPSHRKPALPPMTDVAAMIRGGEKLADIAATFERSIHTIRGHLSLAGFTSEGIERPGFAVDLSYLSTAYREEPWRDLALCQEVDPEIFFPEKGASTRDAKTICRRCEVQTECLDSALARGERFGIWGGISERDRRKLEQEADIPMTNVLTDETRTPATEAAKLAGITYRQLDYWTRQGYVKAGMPGSGHPRGLDDHELTVLRYMGTLVNLGIIPPVAARMARQYADGATMVHLGEWALGPPPLHTPPTSTGDTE